MQPSAAPLMAQAASPTVVLPCVCCSSPSILLAAPRRLSSNRNNRPHKLTLAAALRSEPLSALPRLPERPLRRGQRCRAAASGKEDSPSDAATPQSSTSTISRMTDMDGMGMGENFCLIEDRPSITDFEKYDLRDISQSIQARRTRIFVLMEEVRRLRIEQRLKGGEKEAEKEIRQEKFKSALPFLPPLNETTLTLYYYTYAGLFATIILFGGIISPILEVNLGVGGTTYLDFVTSIGLPSQLAQVDPIVASFCGGAVGVLSALLTLEVSNIKQQVKGRCHYCKGTGYLTCGNCVGSGVDPNSGCACGYCTRSGKVMCTGCLCTGKSLVTEHDPRIDPFD